MLTPRFEYGVAQKNAPPGQPLQSSIARMGKHQCEATRNWRQADAWAMAWQPRSRQRAGWTRIRRPRGARRESRSQQKSCKNKRIGGVWEAMATARSILRSCLLLDSRAGIFVRPRFPEFRCRGFSFQSQGASFPGSGRAPGARRMPVSRAHVPSFRILGSAIPALRGGRQACLSNFATRRALPCHSLKSRMH